MDELSNQERQYSFLLVILQSMSFRHFDLFARTVEDQARLRGYAVFYCCLADRPEELHKVLFHMRPDRVLLSKKIPIETQVRQILRLNIPIALIDHEDKREGGQEFIETARVAVEKACFTFIHS